MGTNDGFEHPGKVELERWLQRLARYFGLTHEAIGHLVRTARIIVWGPGRPISLSADRDGMVNFMLAGAGRVEVKGRDGEISILKFLAPGEFFCLSPPPRSGTYLLRALPHETTTTDVAVVAVWARDAMLLLLDNLPAGHRMRLLETSWIVLSRIGEEKGLLLATRRLAKRIPYALQSLARRFGRKHELGVLLDLELADATLGRFLGANREAVNRQMRALRQHVVTRQGKFIVLQKGLAPAPMQA